MRGSWRFVVAMGFVGVMLGGSGSALAFIDDMEEDFWLPFTHFHLGDGASAGYSSEFARSGTQSYHVEISGWTVRDFGSAYGYAMYATRRAPITELRTTILYERLQDISPSPWDSYSAGVSLDLLDASYRSLGRLRYITSYHASQNAGRCAPTLADVALPAPAGLGTWTDLGRNPTADFPAAPWQSAEYVKISIGFLCAAGLTGARYSLYFDDFMLDAGSRDTDADCLLDLDEEATIYAARVSAAPVARPLAAGGHGRDGIVGCRFERCVRDSVGLGCVDRGGPSPDRPRRARGRGTNVDEILAGCPRVCRSHGPGGVSPPPGERRNAQRSCLDRGGRVRWPRGRHGRAVDRRRPRRHTRRRAVHVRVRDARPGERAALIRSARTRWRRQRGGPVRDSGREQQRQFAAPSVHAGL